MRGSVRFGVISTLPDLEWRLERDSGNLSPHFLFKTENWRNYKWNKRERDPPWGFTKGTCRCLPHWEQNMRGGKRGEKRTVTSRDINFHSTSDAEVLLLRLWIVMSSLIMSNIHLTYLSEADFRVEMVSSSSEASLSLHCAVTPWWWSTTDRA